MMTVGPNPTARAPAPATLMKSRLVMALPAAFFSIASPFWIKKEFDSFALCAHANLPPITTQTSIKRLALSY
jgi:hypothetical protein